MIKNLEVDVQVNIIYIYQMLEIRICDVRLYEEKKTQDNTR